MTIPESSSPAATLRRGFGILEILFGVFTTYMGVDSTTAHRVGGDGIGTGIAHVYGPVFGLIGLAIGYAGYMAWKGPARWWLWQVKMAGLSVGLFLVTTFALILLHSS